MKGSSLIENPFSKILKIQDRMFQVKRVLPESRIKMNIRVVDQEMTDESVTVSLFTQYLDGDRWIDQGINSEQSLKIKQSILTSARSLAIASEL